MSAERGSKEWWRDKFHQVLECVSCQEGTDFHKDWHRYGITEEEVKFLQEDWDAWDKEHEDRVVGY